MNHVIQRRIAVITALLVALPLLLCTAAATADDQYIVTIVQDPRLPQLSAKELELVFDKSARIIHAVQQKHISFKVNTPVSLEEFYAGHQKRLAPYALDQQWYMNPMTSSEEQFKQAIIQSCQATGDFTHLRAAVRAFGDDKALTVLEMASSIADKYIATLRIALALKTIDGKTLLKDNTWTQSSAVHWGIFVHSLPRSSSSHLILTNTVLVDTGIGIWPPDTFMSGCISNSITLAASNASIVSYGGILNKDIMKEASRSGPLSKDEQLTAISYVLAQSCGVSLSGLSPSFDGKAGLARPLFSLKDKNDFADPLKMKIDRDSQSTLDPLGSDLFKARLRMDVAESKRDWNAVIDECDYIVDRALKSPKAGDYLPYFRERAAKARKNLK